MRRPALAWLLLAAFSAGANQGAYLFDAAGCLACHTAEGGEALAGGRVFETPFGRFYSPNITPDPETGIGRWTRGMFVDALKHGRAPDGRAYFPVFPYTSYRKMSDSDARRLFDYLQRRPAVRQSNRPHELPWWLSEWMMQGWQWWFLDDIPAADDAASPQMQRGQYLVDALGHCAECHSPRNWAGITDPQRYLAGNPEGPEGDKVPNITQGRESGIGKWSADDLAYFLETGELPNGDYTGGLMTEVIDNSTSRLRAGDRAAMVTYLRSVEARPEGSAE